MRPIRILGPWIIALPLAAQMHHVDKAQRVTRAVGVYEWTGSMAFIPLLAGLVCSTIHSPAFA